MPTLSNSRQERFAQALVAGHTADAAYKEAGYQPCRSHASRLAAKGHIRARVQELQDQTATQVVINRAGVLDKLLRNSETAFENANITASNRALELIGRAIGVFDNQEATSAHTKLPEEMTEQQLLAYVNPADLQAGEEYMGDGRAAQ